MTTADDGREARRQEVLDQIRALLGELGEVPPEDELRTEVAALRAEIRALREQPHACHGFCGYHWCGHVHCYPYSYASVAAGYNPTVTYVGNTTTSAPLTATTAAGSTAATLTWSGSASGGDGICQAF
jgi:hypothetical protein